MGIYVVKHEFAEATDDPEDVGIVLESVEALSGLGNVAMADWTDLLFKSYLPKRAPLYI